MPGLEVVQVLITGVNGSPGKNGNTAYMIKQVLKDCEELGSDTYLIHVMDALKGQELPYCMACDSPCPGNCLKKPKLAEAYEKLTKADALVIGSPVYFGTVSAQLKAFWDKSRSLRMDKALLGKPSAALAVAASKYGGQETTIRALHDMLLVHGAYIIGDSSLGSGIGHQGVGAQRPAPDDAFSNKRLKVLAEALVEACN